MGKLRVLVVDDDNAVRDACRQVLGKDGNTVEEAGAGRDGLQKLRQEFYEILLLDLKLPDGNGLDLLPSIAHVSPGTSVVVITGFATLESAVEAMRRGACDYLAKPFNPDELRLVIERVAARRQRTLENVCLKENLESTHRHDRIIGDGPAMQSILEFIARFGPTDSTVLITGESGTGKELVARALWRQSTRRDKPFITIDCGSLVGSLFESELFGHVKGAFTGAAATKHGWLELANSGTVFLDEIANVSPEIQAKFLRVIQERKFSRVGGTQMISVDVRIIAATNKDLLQEVKHGRFREDLFYRLCVVPVTLLPLRQRREDIPFLAQHFLAVYSALRKCRIGGFTPEAMDVLMRHNWPGNVRELENAIERAVILASGESITAQDLLCHFPILPAVNEVAAPGSLEELEKQHIQQVLLQYSGKRDRVASHLGIDRKTLWRKIKKYGLLGASSKKEEHVQAAR
jgi:DNA-binding NtrC family response regulator